jgi:hypothetical protein
MHNVNDTTESVIRKLIEDYIPLTQEDKDTIKSYVSDNSDKIPIIVKNLRFRRGSEVLDMHLFLYKKLGIICLLETTSDHDKHDAMTEKFEKYRLCYRPYYKEFLIANFQEFVAYNAFRTDYRINPHEASYTTTSDIELIDRKKRDWSVLCNNSEFIKCLVVNGKLSCRDFYDLQGYPSPEDNEKAFIADYKLKGIEEKIKNYVKKKTGGANINRSIINFSDESYKFNENQPATSVQLTAIELINSSSVLR